MPMPMPCRPRPMIIGTTEEASAQTTEPAASGTEHTSSIRRLPSMSPSRPETGTHTAETSRVAVMTQAAFEAVVFRICGSSAMSGVTMVCMIAATVPAKARVATTPPAAADRGEASIGELLSCLSDKEMQHTWSMHHAYRMYAA